MGDLLESTALKNITVRNLLMALTVLTLILCLVKDDDGSIRWLATAMAGPPVVTGN